MARYSFVQADIADSSAISTAFGEHLPDVVVNFAAESHNSRAVIDPGSFVRTNVLGTQILLEASLRVGIRRFHHISTCEVFGDLALDSPIRFTEEAPYDPTTPYNASKAAADHLVRAYHRTFGLPITISISCNNYGPFQFPEKVIPLFVTNALHDLPLPIYRHSENRREWIHVEDHCAAISAIIENGRVGQTYNVGTGVELTIDQLADRILAILGKPSSLKRYVEDRPGHDRRYLLDHTKIESELGWRPRIDLDEGLAETVAWYKSNRSWWSDKRSSAIDESAWAATQA
jgi:dTDP-glucose 4,6-dehydratase